MLIKKKLKKADLAINTIFIMLLSVISLAILISFFSGNLGPLSNKVYCNTIFPAQSKLFISSTDGIEDERCSRELVLKTARINCSNAETEILAYSLACWEKASFGDGNKNLPCFELAIPEGCVLSVTEEAVTQQLIDNNLCNMFSNDIIPGCGTENNLNFTKDINTQTNVFIEYKAQTKRVVVS